MAFKKPSTELKRLRKKAGLSPAELADRAGVAFRTVYNIENGENVTFTVLKKVFISLGYQITDFKNLIELKKTSEL
jgi:transcriptional regulator with XRE-family HTH domain